MPKTGMVIMSKGRNKPGREKKKPKAEKVKGPKPQTEIRRIEPVLPKKADVEAREVAQKNENARVRQAVHGSSFLSGDPETYKSGGVTILSGKTFPIPKRPEIVSKHKRVK